MFWKRKITISRPQQEVESILKQQLRINIPFGEVQDNSFTLYKSVSHTSFGQKGIHLFLFHGTYSQIGLDTALEYTVSLPLHIYILLTFLCALGVYFAVSFLMNSGSLLYAGLALLICLLLIIGITAQGNTCIERFEKLLTQDTARR